MKHSKAQLTPAQFMLCVLPITTGTVYFPVAGVVVPLAGTAGWLAVLLAFALSLLWVAMAAALCRWAPIGDWPSAVDSWLGPWLGRAVLFYLGVIGLWLGGLLLLQGSLVFHAVALPATPPLALTLATLLLVIYTDWQGVEVLARTIQVLFISSLPLLLGFLVSTVPMVQMDNLQPWLGRGPAGLAHASYLAAPWPMEGVIFTLFLGCLVRDRRALGRQASAAIAVAGVMLSGVALITVGVLGTAVAESYIYPTVSLILSTSVGRFLQGLEIFIYPLWLLTSYTKTVALFVLTTESLRGLIPRLPRIWRTVLVGAAYLTISLIPQNLGEMVAAVGRVDNSLITGFYLLLPIIWLATWWRRRRSHA